MSKARNWLWLGLALAALIGGYVVWRAQPRELVMTRARIGQAVELVYATGFVEPDQPVSVAARLTAPVMQVLVDEGDRVRKGQPLLILDDEDLRGLLAQARAQSRGTLLAERRITTLFAQGWVTRAARDEAVTAADATRALERAAEAHVRQNVIRAGIDGIVLKRDVEPGELVTPTRVLMLLGDTRRIRVTATVDERDVPRVQVGQQALMSSDAWPGRILRGHVRALTPGGDPTQRAFRVRLALDQAAELPMGLTLEVNIVTGRVEKAVLVPSSAVRTGHIWIVEAGRVHHRAVRTGLVDGTTTEVRSGVRSGDLLVADPPSDLAEGDRVRARPA